MALTGLALTGFVIVHMSGNLLIFRGRDALNSYALFLKDRGGLLWAARGRPAGRLRPAHLAGDSADAAQPGRPADAVRLRGHGPGELGVADDDLVSGLVILAFVIFHLMHYTFGLVAATAPNGTNYPRPA